MEKIDALEAIAGILEQMTPEQRAKAVEMLKQFEVQIKVKEQ